MKLATKIPFAGFYNSSHDAVFDSWLEQTQTHLADEYKATNDQIGKLADLYFDKLNWKAIHIAYAKKYLEAFEDMLATEGSKHIPIEWDNMESPREYNFATDCIYGKIELTDLHYMLNAIPSDIWKAYVKSECTSYDGFISFYSPDYEDWNEDLTTWGEARLGMILECYLKHVCDKELENLTAWDLMENMQCNGGIETIIFDNADKEFVDYINQLESTKEG